MARFEREEIDPGSTASEIWEDIKNILSLNPCVEIRQAAPGSQKLVLITWLDDPIDFSKHTQVP